MISEEALTAGISSSMYLECFFTGTFQRISHLFWNVKEKAADDENLNMTLEAVFNGIENSAKGTASENDMAGLFDDFDVNSNKIGATVAKK